MKPMKTAFEIYLPFTKITFIAVKQLLSLVASSLTFPPMSSTCSEKCPLVMKWKFVSTIQQFWKNKWEKYEI